MTKGSISACKIHKKSIKNTVQKLKLNDHSKHGWRFLTYLTDCKINNVPYFTKQCGFFQHLTANGSRSQGVLYPMQMKGGHRQMLEFVCL